MSKAVNSVRLFLSFSGGVVRISQWAYSNLLGLSLYRLEIGKSDWWIFF